MMNRVVLIGRLTKDPELYYTKQGIAYARICVAVNRGFRNSLESSKQITFTASSGENRLRMYQIIVKRDR